MKTTALTHCHSILDLRNRARCALPSAIFDFIDGAAETEITARRNIAAFDDLKLIPRSLVDVGKINTTTRILGQEIEWPVFCAPTGCTRLVHPNGELAVARAAAKAGTLYSLSTMSTCSIERVAGASGGPKMFQLYVLKDRDLSRELIERARRSGYRALCVTVDAPVGGKCERDYRSGLFGPAHKWPLGTVIGFARHPFWGLNRLGKAGLFAANFEDSNGDPMPLKQLGEQLGQVLDPSVTWKDIREIADLWGGPFAIKGIMSPDDARRAADAGATAIIVSNHGGLQLDGVAAAIEALPRIVSAVGDRLEVILDSGIRRGVHVLKALASGAKACSIGRPYLYGLSAGGEAGVAKALGLLRAELILAMQLSGCTDLESIDPTLIGQLR